MSCRAAGRRVFRFKAMLRRTVQTQLTGVVRALDEFDQVMDGYVVFQKQAAEGVDAGCR
jgi:hypothetical protein